MKIYERIIPWRKNRKKKDRKTKVQDLGMEEVEAKWIESKEKRLKDRAGK